MGSDGKRAELSRVVVLALAGIAVVFAPVAAWAGFPGKNGRIVYDSEWFIAGKYGVTARTIVTFQLRRPTSERNFPACSGQGGVIACDGAGDPAYARDGRRIAFLHGGFNRCGVSCPYGPWPYEPRSLAIANDDGSNLRKLPRFTAEDSQPAWSPRGRSIVFRGRSGANYDLYVVGTDGSGLRRLTYRPARDADPAWTGARGGWIGFARGGDVFRIRPNGTGLRRLTRGGGREPAWSPDGSRIAYTRKGNVHVMRADGSKVRRLTRKGGSAPVWSPDGKLMLFRKVWRSPGGFAYGDLYVMRSDGRFARRLMPTPDDLINRFGPESPDQFDWGRRPQ